VNIPQKIKPNQKLHTKNELTLHNFNSWWTFLKMWDQMKNYTQQMNSHFTI
jgi:hypothetical protein